jgi:hypothetical protein
MNSLDGQSAGGGDQAEAGQEHLQEGKSEEEKRRV